MARSGTPDSPVFCGIAAKNAQKTTGKKQTPMPWVNRVLAFSSYLPLSLIEVFYPKN
jgi:hypothetical protein